MSNHSPSPDTSDAPSSSLVEHMYDTVAEEICIEMLACVHTIAKNNEMPIRQLAKESIFDVKITSPKTISSSSPMRKTQSSKSNTERNLDNPNNMYQGESSSRLRTRGVDVWGRIPPREVLTQCQNCGLKVSSSSRFAIHLDKCLLASARSRSNSRVK